jgi:hypothetical protein
LSTFNAVLNKKRLLEARQLQLALAAAQLFQHRLQQRVPLGVGARRLRRALAECAQANAAENRSQNSCSRKSRNRSNQVHDASVFC